jgi:hypothetical protein
MFACVQISRRGSKNQRDKYVDVFTPSSCEGAKNSRHKGSHVHCLAAKAFCGVNWDEGLEYLTTSEMRPTAVLRSERSR